MLRHTLLAILLAAAATAAAQSADTTVVSTPINPNDEFTITDGEGNTEEVEFPEAMTYDLDSLLAQYMAQTYLTTDADCRTADQNPDFPEEVYIERLSRLPAVMEMPYNEAVRKCIDRYMVRLRHAVSYMLGAANFYMPIFEEALEAYQLPLELKYLPVIESALKPTAVSRAGAAGLWQFMPATGKDYGLQLNSLVDERRDPQKASIAAARYLKDLYAVFGDWTLVIAAYNCGPANINKAIHRAGGEKDYWKIYPYLPAETRGYVPAFIAANYAMTYYCEHNICPMTTQLPAKTDTVRVDRQLHLQQVAGVLGIDIEQLRAINPEFRRDVVPASPAQQWALRLPLGDATRFIDMQDSIYSYQASQLLNRRTQVEPGTPRSAAKPAKGRRSQRGARTVTVRRGDTLAAIARRNGTTVQNLRRLNGIRGNNIQAGKKIRVR